MDAPANRATRKEHLSRKNEAASVRACMGTFILITLSVYRFHFSSFTASQLARSGAHLRFSPKIEMDRETTTDKFVPSPLQGLRDDCVAAGGSASLTPVCTVHALSGLSITASKTAFAGSCDTRQATACHPTTQLSNHLTSVPWFLFRSKEMAVNDRDARSTPLPSKSSFPSLRNLLHCPSFCERNRNHVGLF